MKNTIKNEFNAHIQAANSLHDLTNTVSESAQICINCFKNDGKILIFGNGGSAADAQHIAAEMVGRYKVERRGLPAIALTTDTSALTSIGNDYGYDYVFARQVEALANKEDVLIGISTSGRSANVINALKLSKEIGCKTIGLSGRDGGEMNKLCTVNVVVSNQDTPRIQELHIVIGHTICQLIDQSLKN
jgi:D-sedoheptulose 7-phosphate isomerase